MAHTPDRAVHGDEQALAWREALRTRTTQVAGSHAVVEHMLGRIVAAGTPVCQQAAAAASPAMRLS